ncbi:MAG: site-2 protease family protein [Verrucomicrobia bacterium]|nr:site-2 protease family protein [Verrucomicrobiota bacterium]
MNPDLLPGAVWYAVFLFSTVLHEAAHAWSAHRMGDDTAFRGGQVSLNPWPHIRREPIGMVVVPILSWLLGGWMIGWASAPYDVAWALRHPRRAGLMALAGPAANLLLLLLAALLIRVGIEWNVLIQPGEIDSTHLTTAAVSGPFELGALLLSVMFSLNLLLFAFNLLPLPPLDGSSLPLLFLSKERAHAYSTALQNPLLRIGGLIVAFKLTRPLFHPLFLLAANWVYPGAGYG